MCLEHLKYSVKKIFFYQTLFSTNGADSNITVHYKTCYATFRYNIQINTLRTQRLNYFESNFRGTAAQINALEFKHFTKYLPYRLADTLHNMHMSFLRISISVRIAQTSSAKHFKSMMKNCSVLQCISKLCSCFIKFKVQIHYLFKKKRISK